MLAATKLRYLASFKVPARFFSVSPWSKSPFPIADPIFELQEQFNADKDPRKLILGIGAYRDDNGKPCVLPSIREAERRITGKCDHEYSTLAGIPEFNDLAAKYAFGADCKPLKQNRIATCQAISGSGALRLLAQLFVDEDYCKEIYLPKPTWANHNVIFEKTGIKCKSYRYLNPDRPVLNYEGILEDIDLAPEGSTFFFHACAHNPTGVDPSHKQWDQISKHIRDKNHRVIFDAAYLGYASGSIDNDAYSIRKFVDDGHYLALCLSFSKNFGLYGERVGCTSIVCEDYDEKKKVLEQLKCAARSLWSLSPLYGARLVSEILRDPKLYKQWEGECRQMSERIKSMRYLLVDNLAKCGSAKDWSHITNQIGMFSFTGLSPEQIDRLREQYHVYILRNGRASVSGINTHNVEYIAKAMHEVTK
ncbi:hypothetical protein WA158_002114 [Blastocystis sp. Blastoise]